MRVRFYPRGDGLRPEAPATSIGDVALTPNGLLEALEEQLGLPAVNEMPGDSVVAYQACLAAADRPTRFYHGSFAIDPVNVARTLLDWRARWYEAGWNGAFAAGAPRRLADVAAIETLAASRVQPCRGQRLARVAAALESGRRAGVERIALIEPLATLPRAWRRVLSHLEVTEAPPLEARAEATTDLGRLQRRLLDPAGSRAPLAFAGDGSVVAVRAVSRDVSAQAVAEYARERRDLVLIAERDGIILDNALERVGLPRAGFQHLSPLRGVTEVLKLSLALVWRPLAPRALLKFLVHPVSPLRRALRGRLAAAVAEQPGIGGARWRETLDEFEADDRSRVELWLEGERFDPTAGAPCEALAEIARRVASWLAGRAARLESSAEIALYGSALGQAQAFARAVDAFAAASRAVLPRALVDALLDEICTDAPDPSTRAQAGHARATTEPGYVPPCDEVVWWDIAAQSHEPVDPWSRAELAALERAGVELPRSAERHARRRRRWQKPVLEARRRLILVRHDRDVRGHVLWHHVTTQCVGLPSTALDATLLDGIETIPLLAVATRPLTLRPLSRPRRFWQLPPGVAVPQRARESYSSLAELIQFPHQWALERAASIREGRATDLPRGPLLYGRLAHTLVERFFAEHPDWASLDPGSIDAWLDRTLPETITQVAASLREPGSGVEHERVTSALERALPTLIEQLRAARVVDVRSEAALEAPFAGVQLVGAIDLWVTRDDGRMAVIDLKWGGESWRTELLAKNRHLQLATYGALVRATTGGPWPAQAFFILVNATLLARDRAFFADATVPTVVSRDTIDDLWRQAELTVEWRRAQLAQGRIEVIAEATVAQGEGTNAFGLDLGNEVDKFEPFGALLGWDEFK